MAAWGLPHPLRWVARGDSVVLVWPTRKSAFPRSQVNVKRLGPRWQDEVPRSLLFMPEGT